MKLLIKRFAATASFPYWESTVMRACKANGNLAQHDVGAFVYRTANIGDEIQTLAAIQFLPRAHTVLPVDRDRLREFRGRGKKVIVLFNGWHTHDETQWPPSDDIVPIFEGFHLANAEVLNQSGVFEYLRTWGPIGCRDTYTAEILNNAGIAAYFSGCPTLLLRSERKEGQVRHDTIVIDAHLKPRQDFHVSDSTGLFQRIVPSDIKAVASYQTQNVKGRYTELHGVKLWRAKRRLIQLARARLVITNRLHVALPCLALETPCVFLHEQPERDPRLKDYLPYLHFASNDVPLGDFDWHSPIAKRLPVFVNDLRRSIIRKVAHNCDRPSS
jgi:hypothetical protein